MRKDKSLLIAILVLLSAAVLLGGCGTESTEEIATALPEPTAAASPSPESTQAPRLTTSPESTQAPRLTTSPDIQTPEPDIEATTKSPDIEVTTETEQTVTPQPAGPTAVIVSGDSTALGQPFTCLPGSSICITKRITCKRYLELAD